MNKLALLLLPLCLLSILQCTVKNPTESNRDYSAFVSECDTIAAKQAYYGNLLTEYFFIEDSAAAFDAIVDSILQDSLVDTAYHDSVNIYILNKNGVVGGITTERFPDNDDSVLFKKAKTTKLSQSTDNTIKACYVVGQGGVPMKNTDFESILTSNLGAEVSTFAATLSNLCKLSGYDIVYLQGHGSPDYLWYTPFIAFGRVYFMTSQVYVSTDNVATSFPTDLTQGDLTNIYSIVTKKSYYHVSSGFLNRHNDFSRKEVLFLGNFCYSLTFKFQNSGWKSLGDNNDAIVGYNSLISTPLINEFMGELLNPMSNKNREEPLKLSEWYSAATKEKPGEGIIYPGTSKQQYIHFTASIAYKGNGNLTLWNNEHSSNTSNTECLDGTWIGTEDGAESQGSWKLIIQGNLVKTFIPTGEELYSGTAVIDETVVPHRALGTVTSSNYTEYIGKKVYATYTITNCESLTWTATEPGEATSYPTGEEGENTRTFFFTRQE